MKPHQKIGIGAALASVGGALTVLVAILGTASLGEPWSFIVGFVTGILAGSGAALSIAGLVECRRAR